MTIAPVPVDEAVPGPRPDGLDDSALLALYTQMARVRAFEHEVIDAFDKGLIPGSTHPCIGAEGIKAGSARRPSAPTTSSSPPIAATARRSSRGSIPWR